MADPEDTGKKHGGAPPFQPGQSGNPAGRPKGARNKLGEQFLQDLYASWQEYGAETLETVRVEKPDQYVKVIASILPKELNVKVSELDDLTDAELERRIAALADALRLEVGASSTDAGGEASPGPQSLN